MAYFLSYVVNTNKQDPFLGHASLLLTEHTPPKKPHIICKVGFFVNQVMIEDKMFRPAKYNYQHKTYPITTAEMTRFLQRVNKDRRMGLYNPTRKRSSETPKPAEETTLQSTPGGPEFSYFKLNCKTYVLSVMRDVGIVDAGLSNWFIDIPVLSGSLHTLEFETTSKGSFWTIPMVVSKRTKSQTFKDATKKEIKELSASVMAIEYVTAFHELESLAAEKHLDDTKGIKKFRQTIKGINAELSNPKIRISKKFLLHIQSEAQVALNDFEQKLKRNPNKLARRFLDTVKNMLNYLIGTKFNLSPQFEATNMLHGYKKLINKKSPTTQPGKLRARNK